MTLAVLAGSCTKNGEDVRHYDSRIFIDEEPQVELLYEISDEQTSETRELSISIPSPAESEVSATFKFDPALADRFNAAYGESALPYDGELISIENARAVITEGNITSEPASVTFNGRGQLESGRTYVAPIVLSDVSGMDVLESKSVVYYVFREAALINVVADISQNYFPVKWNVPVGGLRTITVEALINVRDFGLIEGKGEAISTLFGIENNFLIRIGDASFPQNQIQLAAAGDKFPGGSKKLGLPTNQWVHVAVVWDSTTGDRIIYHDGKEIARDEGAVSTGGVNLTTECYIGRSYNDERWLEGQISEMRIWTVQRTPEQLKANVYSLDPEDPANTGLLAYWKFDEGSGNVVKDHSGNGNDVTAAKTLQWVNVSLPEE